MGSAHAGTHREHSYERVRRHADPHALHESDHVWFAAGEAVAHHIENRSAAPFRFLVFGERKAGDVVFYPNGRLMMVKALGNALFEYARPADDASKG